jgi:filamentous hemagglutinin family protein
MASLLNRLNRSTSPTAMKSGYIGKLANVLMLVSMTNVATAPSFAQVVADGRTETSVVTNGLITDVTTGTIRAGNAFNSFSQLSVRQLETVILHQPTNSNALINVVIGSQTNIEGTLNTLKNGAVGGNVFIVNPDGVMVSSGGVINAGALTISTATSSFANRLLDAASGADQSAVSTLFAGLEPLSATGSIDIYGEINARRLELRSGARMIIEGRLSVVDAQGNATGEAAVNTDGVAEASSVSVQGGVIRLFGGGDVVVSGKVEASRVNDGGDISVRSDGDITVTGDISANGTGDGDGGSVVVFADGAGSLVEAATLSASAMQGDGGFVELSGKSSITWSGTIDVSSQAGAQGAILIDPATINVTSNIFTNGADLTLLADEAITVAAGVIISTRETAADAAAEAGNDHATVNSLGVSGDLVVFAPEINLEDGAQIYAQGNNGFDGGIVVLLAEDREEDFNMFVDTTDTRAEINLTKTTIRAGAVVISAAAKSSNIISPFPGLEESQVTIADLNVENAIDLIEETILGVPQMIEDIYNRTKNSLNALVPLQVQLMEADADISILDSSIIVNGNWKNAGLGRTDDPTPPPNNGLVNAQGEMLARYLIAVDPDDANPTEPTGTGAQEVFLPEAWDTTTDSIYIQSHAETEISISPLAFALGVGVGVTDTASALTITNSTIHAVTGNVVLNSTAAENVNFNLAAKAVADVSVGVIVSSRSLTNQLIIDGGSVNAVTGNLSVTALTGKNQSLVNLSNAGKSGKFALAVTVSVGDALTEAAVSGDLDAGGDVSVDAETVYFGRTSATTTTLGVTDPLKQLIKSTATGLLASVQTAVQGSKDQAGGASQGNATPKAGFGGGSSIDVALENDETYASIGGSYRDLDNDRALVVLDATTVDAGGDFGIDATQRFASAIEGGTGLSRDVSSGTGKLTLIAKAQAAVLGVDERDLIGTQGNALFLNVSVSSMTGVTVAEIGSAATVNADKITVNAQTAYDLNPFEQFETAWDGLQDQWAAFNAEIAEIDLLDEDTDLATNPLSQAPNAPVLLDVINPLNYLTTTTASKGNLPTPGDGSGDDRKDQDLAVGITVNYFNTSNETRAVIRDGATVTARGTGADGGVIVNAQTSGLFVHMANKPTRLAPGSTGPNNGIGGAVSVSRNVDVVEALIEGDAEVTTDTLDVTALNDKLFITGVFAGGSAAKVSINAGVGANLIDNITTARISDRATVDAGLVVVDAKDTADAWGISGVTSRSENVGVGASGVINIVDRSTSATVSAADITADLTGTADELRFKADGLNLTATNNGLQVAAAIAGAIIQGKKEPEAPASTDTNDDNMIVPSWMLSGEETNSVNNTNQDVKDDQGNKDKKTGWAVSGAATLNLIETTTTAGIASNAQLAVAGPLNILADNATTSITVAGAVSASTDKKQNTNAIAASLALTTDDRETRALILGARIVDATVVDVEAKDRSTTVGVAVGGAGAAKGSITIAGSVAINTMSGSTQTDIDDAEITADTITLNANDNSTNVGVAGAVSINMTKNEGAGVGLGVAVNTFSRGTEISVTSGSLLTATGLTLLSTSNVGLYGFGIAGGAGKIGFGGAVAVNTVSGGAVAEVLGGEITADTVTISAIETNEIWSLGGALSLGRNTAVGGAVTVNTLTTETAARLNGATVTGRVDLGAVTVTGSSTSTIGTIAVAGAAATQSTGIGVGVAVNLIDADAVSSIAGSTITDAGAVSATAISNRTIQSLAGGIAAAGKSAAGFGATVNIMTGTSTTASLDGSNITGAASIMADADSTGQIDSIAAAISLSKNTAIGGAATVNVSDAVTRASASNATLDASGAIDVDAMDTVQINSLAGQISGSKGSAIGAAISANVIGHTVEAISDTSDLTSGGGGIEIAARSGADINTLAAAVGISGNASINGSVTVNDIGNTIRARADGTELNAGFGTIDILAEKGTEISSLAGTIAGSGGNAFGVAVAVNVIHDTVTADLGGNGPVTAGTLNVKAGNSTTSGQASLIESLAAAGSGASGTAVAGSLVYTQIGKPGGTDARATAAEGSSASDDPILGAISATEDGRDGAFGMVRDSTSGAITQGGGEPNVIAFDLDAEDITRATVSLGAGAAAQPLDVDAINVETTDTANIKSLAGAAAIGGSNGFGAAFSINLLFGHTQSELILPAMLPTSEATVLDGEISVQSLSDSRIQTGAIALGAGGSIGGAGSVTVNILNRDSIARMRGQGTTDATRSEIATSGGRVTVRSDQVGTIESLAGAVAIGGTAGVGGAVAVNVMSDDGFAAIDGVDLDAGTGLVVVEATQSTPQDQPGEDDVPLLGIAVAGAGGSTGAFGGSFVVNSNTSSLTTRIRNATVAARDITNSARSDVDMSGIAGAAAFDGVASVALAVVANLSDMTIMSEIDRATLKASRNVVIDAVADASIGGIAVGAAISGGIGITGSGVANISSNDVTAQIVNTGADVADGFGGSDVLARGTVLMRAEGRSVFQLLGGGDEEPGLNLNISVGGAAGIGAAVTVNEANNQITARVAERSRVTGLGFNTANSTRLGTVRGVAIEANALSDIAMVTVNGAVGGVAGVAGLFAFNIVSDDALVVLGNGTTEGAAQINGILSETLVHGGDPVTVAANTGQQTRIKSLASSTVDGYGGSVGIGGTAGVGAVSSTSLIESTAITRVDSSSVGAANLIDIDAEAVINLQSYFAGLGGGFVGGAATVGVNILKSEALVELRGANISGGGFTSATVFQDAEIDIDALVTTNSTSFVGAISGGVVGLGGAINVNDYETTSRINVVSGLADNRSVVSAGGDVNMLAKTMNTVEGNAAGGAVGGFALALTVNVNQMNATTVVDVANGQSISSDALLTLQAQDINSMTSLSGAVGGGAIGVGASVDYNRFGGATQVLVGSDVTLSGASGVVIDASSRRTINSTVVVGQAAGTVAISVAVSVVEMGANADKTEAQSAIDDTDDELKNNDQDTDDGSNNRGSVEGLTAFTGADGTRDRVISARQAVSVKAERVDDVGVTIGDRTSVTSDASVLLASDVHVNVDQFGGALAAGGLAGIASGTTVSNIGVASQIIVGRNVQLEADDLVSLRATTTAGDGGTVNAEAATIALSAGISAGVGVVKATTSSRSEITIRDGVTIGGTSKSDVDRIEITASRGDQLRGETFNLSLGLAAAGAVVVDVENIGTAAVKIGQSSPTVLPSATTATVLNAGTIVVSASDDTSTTTEGVGSTGGVIGLNSVVVSGLNNGIVRTHLDNARLLGSHVSVKAVSAARASATAEGVSFGFVALGASVAIARIDATVETMVFGDSQVIGNTVTIGSELNNSGGRNAYAVASSASGGAIAGTGSSATATVDYNVSTKASGTLHGTTLLDINSTANRATAHASASGVSGGIVSGGAVFATAGQRDGRNGLVSTTIGKGNLTGGAVAIGASGLSSLTADVVAGSGGILSATSAEAKNTGGAITTTTVGTGDLTIEASSLVVGANTDAQLFSKINNLNASLVGVSGALGSDDFNSIAGIMIGGDATLKSFDLDFGTLNAVSRDTLGGGITVTSGSGGALDVAAMRGLVTVTGRSDLIVSDGAIIEQLGTADNPGMFTMGLRSDFDLTDRQKLDSGGAIAIPRGDSRVVVDRNDSILRIGNADITSVGKITIYNGANADLYSEVAATTYGFAGAATGDSRAEFNSETKIFIDAGALIESLGDIEISAGRTSDGAQTVAVNAETRLFNKTAIPIPTPPNADAIARTTSLVSIANGAEIKAVEDVAINSIAGGRDVLGSGRGKDLWREAAEAVGNFFGGLVGADDISLDIEGGTTTDVSNNGVSVDGLVRAGSRNKQVLILDQNNTPTLDLDRYPDATTENREGIVWSVDLDVLVADELQKRIDLLTTFIENKQLNRDAAALLAWRAERDRLEAQAAASPGTTDIIRVGDIRAVEGNIAIRADWLQGATTGELNAPGDALIQVLSQSKAFIETQRMSIPVNGGGLVTLNDVSINNATEARSLSRLQSGTFAFDIINGENSDDPKIEIVSASSVANSGTIIVSGDIDNFRGLVAARSAQGDLIVQADISAKTIRLEVPNGDFIQGYEPGNTSLGGDPEAQYADYFGRIEDTYRSFVIVEAGRPVNVRDNQLANADRFRLAPSESVISAGKNVFVSADILNINGLIQAGRGAYDVTINAGIDKYIADNFNDAQTGRTLLQNTDPEGAEQNAFIQSDAFVFYDHDDNRIEIDNMIVQGGRVELIGNVISTGSGRVEALDGLGRVNLNSDAATTIAMSRIDVGEGLEGIEGLVRITDTARAKPGAADSDNPSLITEFSRIGNQIEIRNNQTTTTIDDPDRVINDGVGPQPQKTVLTNLVSQTTGRSTSYAPLANRDYVTLRAEETVVTQYLRDETLVVIGLFKNTSTKTTKPLRTDTDTVELGFAPYVTTSLTTGGDYRYDFKGERYDYVQSGRLNERETHNSVRWYKLGSGWIHDEYEIQTTTRQFYTHRLKADYPISILFSGADKGSISLQAAGNIVFTDVVNNQIGNTAVTSTAGSILTDSVQIQLSTDVTSLAARGGSIRGVEGAFRLDQTAAGALTLEARDNIIVSEMNGNMNLVSATATRTSSAVNAASSGNVMLTAQKSILQVGSGSVTGTNINLTATEGALGADGTPFRVNTVGEGRLTAIAKGDVSIAETKGNLGVQSVVSQTGDVVLSALTGAIVDRNDIEQPDAKSSEELLALWTGDLALNGSGAAQRRLDSIQALKARREVEYAGYWNLRGNGAGNLTYQLAADTEEALRSGGWTDDQVNAYVADRQEGYDLWNAAAAQVNGYEYTLAADEVDEVWGEGTWSQDELTRSLRAGLVRQTGDTVINIEDANISAAGSITLIAQSSVGELTAPISIATGSDVSTEALLALASAERNDVTFRLADGRSLSLAEFDVFKDGGGDTTGAAVEIRQLEDIDIAFTGLDLTGRPLGDLTITTTTSEVFLGAEQEVAVSGVSSPGEVQIKIDGDLTDVSGAGGVAVSGSIIVLESGNNGSIGSEGTPFSVKVLGSGTLEARSGLDVWLSSPTANAFPIAGIFAGGQASVASEGAITDSVGQDVPRIIANDIDLTGSSIGTVSALLGLRLADDATGDVTLEATSAGIFVKGHEVDMPLVSLRSARGGLIETDTVLQLTGVNTLQFGLDGLGTSEMTLLTNGGVVASGTGTDISGDALMITSGGEAGQPTRRVVTAITELSYGSQGTGPTPLWVSEVDDLIIGSIVQNGNAGSIVELMVGENLFGGTVSGAELRFDVVGNIGQDGAPIIVTTGRLDAKTDDGDIDLLLQNRATDIEGVVAGGAGSIDLQSANAPLTLLAGEAGIQALNGSIDLTITSMQANASILTNTGPVQIISGNFTQANGTEVNAGSGEVDITITGNMQVASVATTATGADALRLSVSGTLSDAGNADIDLIANADGAVATLRVGALAPTGPNGLAVALDTLDVVVDTGDMHIRETDGLSVASVATPNGNIDLFSGGRMVLSQATGTQSVVLSALGDIATDAGLVSGDTISLFSLGGSLTGETGQFMLMDTSEGADVRLVGQNAIFYRETAGDLTSSFVLADTGDVSVDVAAGIAVIDLIGTPGNLRVVAQDLVRINQVGGASVDIADEVQLMLIEPSRFGPGVARNPLTSQITALNDGSEIEIGLINTRNEIALQADFIDADVNDPGGQDGLDMILEDSTGSFAEEVDVRVTGDGILDITRGRVTSGQVTYSGPVMDGTDIIINGDVFFRRGDFDLLATIEFAELDTEVDAQVLTIDEGAMTFRIVGENILITDGLVLNRKLAGVDLNGGQGFTGEVGLETEILGGTFVRGLHDASILGYFFGLENTVRDDEDEEEPKVQIDSTEDLKALLEASLQR